MDENQTCPHCGQKHLLPDVPLLTGDSKHELKYRLHCHVSREMFGFVTLSTKAEEITATVCVDCGHVDLFVKNTADLRRIYEEKHR